MSTTKEIKATTEYAVRSMLTIARLPATPADDDKWCETMLDYMDQAYKAGQQDANAALSRARGEAKS